MARHRSHSIAFKRQVAREFMGGATLHGLAKRHDLSRNLVRVWVGKHEAGARARVSRRGFARWTAAEKRDPCVVTGPAVSPSQKDAG